MNQKNNTWIVLLIVTILLLTGLLVGWFMFKPKKTTKPTPVQSSLPVTEYSSLKGEIIKMDLPLANQEISSPLSVAGQVRGNWSFEGSFPLTLEDANGKVLANGFATLNGEWMTTDYVPFTANLIFAKPATKTGKLILRKDNPSAQTELDDSLEIPVKFE